MAELNSNHEYFGVALSDDAIHALNRLLAIQCRSFPQYLRYARPYVPSQRSEVVDALEAIARDQDGMEERISRMVIDAGALPRTGGFPMEFTDLHDLDIDYLLAAAIRYQEQDVAAIQTLVERLQGSPSARAIAEETLGMAKGHLDTLHEVADGAPSA